MIYNASSSGRESKLLSKFGWSNLDYENKLKEQNGVCGICSNLCATGQRLGIDHNHDTMQNRGLLCKRCNGFIAWAQEDVRILENAIKYLERYNG
jgi:hypothetical protein